MHRKKETVTTAVWEDNRERWVCQLIDERWSTLFRIYPIKDLVHHPKVRDWCGLPYPNHPKGCPNFNIDKEKCPPNAPYVTDVFDLEKPLYFVHSEFDLAGHAEKMKIRHPNWTERQCRNVLYWQNTSRKQAKERAILAMEFTRSKKFTLMPEALGVNVYVTGRWCGLKLEMIDGLKICRHVALLGDTI